MKTLFSKIGYGFSILITLISCGKDNYEAPSSQLSGKVTYNGSAVGVRGSNESVRLQLWQDGYSFRSPIDVYITQDGSFSAQLFDGTYKLTTVSGNGPWQHGTDTLLVNVKGNTNIDFPVDPYYALADSKYELQGNQLKATFRLDKLDPTHVADSVYLLINDTKFVDLAFFTKKAHLTAAQPGLFTLTMDITPFLAGSQPIFARIAATINGVTEAVYDPTVTKIK